MKRIALILCASLLLITCSRKLPAQAEAEAATGPITVEMKIEAQKHVGLQVDPVEAKQLTEFLQVTGSIQPIDSRVSMVRSLARGRLQEIFVKSGDRVTAGQSLALIDNIEAGELISQQQSAQAELQRDKVQVASQAKQLERSRRLVQIGAAAQKDLELAETEQQTLQQNVRSQESVVNGITSRLRRFGAEEGNIRLPVITTIRAPFAGIVTKAPAASGELIEATTELFTIADLSRVWVQAEVYEKDLGRVQVGQNAIISVDTYPNEKFAGRVAYVSDVLDPQTRTAKVRCELANPGFRLKLDMFASVQVPTTFSKNAIAVPVAALQQIENKNVLFIQKDETSFEMRAVESGNTVNGQIEIVSGIKAGEKVVTQGAFHLKSILAGKELGEE